MTENPFYAFVSLVELDQAIDQKNIKREKLNVPMVQARARVEQQEQIAHACKEQLVAVRKSVAAQDLELKALQQQEQQKRKKLDAVNTAKEYEALQHELQTLLAQVASKEEEMFKLWSAYETHEAQCKKQEEHTREVHIKADKEIGQIEEEQATLAAEAEELALHREKALKAAPEEFVAKYETMRKTIKNPVVPVVQNACSGCSTQIMNLDLLQLHKHVILACKACYRLLYMK